MTALAILTLVIFTACVYWIEAEQADWDRKHYEPRTRTDLDEWEPGYVERNREIDQWARNLDDPKARARPGIE